MTKCVNSPNFLCKIENLNSFDKLVCPIIFLNGLKWQLTLSRFKGNNAEKIQLVLYCLNAPETTSLYTVRVDYVKADGIRKELKSDKYNLKDKEWCIWSDSISSFQCSYGEMPDYTFLAIVTPTGSTSTVFNNLESVQDYYTSPCLESLVDDFGKLFNNDEHSDFVLKCGEKKFYVHKVVLSARSGYFAGMFRSNMREANVGEGSIENMDPDILERVLRYLYTGEISRLSLENIRKVYTAADRFLVEPLKFKCYSLFIDNFASASEIVCNDDANAGSREFKETQLLKNLFMSREWTFFSQEFKHRAHEMCRPYLLIE